MTDLPPEATPPEAQPRLNSFYFTAWRWHFYAGLYVVPFLLMLAVTGALMVWFTAIDSEYGDRIAIAPAAQALGVGAQIAAAEAAHPGSRADKYIAPRDDRTPAIVRVQDGETARMLAVDPYSGAVVSDRPEAGTWNDWLTNLHGELLWGGNGGPGDTLVEIAASLAVMMLASGLYLAWPRQGKGWRAVLVPDLTARGRSFWKSLHVTTGVWVALFLAFFLLTGMSWTGVWGGRIVQPWSSFPAAKWDAVPLSDATHAAMNHTAQEEVPWVLELVPLPASGSQAGGAASAAGHARHLRDGDGGGPGRLALTRGCRFRRPPMRPESGRCRAIRKAMTARPRPATAPCILTSIPARCWPMSALPITR
ncbi:PepSY-associated TM helix domain-containing protein [Rhodobacter capsulatus]|uniref:PepSY-associated TM helix domain-containing protein n=1 Tax=Rhodobacter capsulatus TaxID=1061 RepID=UPI0040263555